MDNQLLKNKTALITGASRGIGEAIAIEFAKQGANLILLARDKNALDNLSLKLEKYQTSIMCFPCDITDQEAVKNIFKEISRKTTLDILVNNAGIMKAKPMAFIKLEDVKGCNPSSA
jgi:short-subunit dehydrogenase